MSHRQLEQVVIGVVDLIDGALDLVRAPEQRRQRRFALLPVTERHRPRRRR